jgi:nicotinate-nucleotide adenylyltransferase
MARLCFGGAFNPIHHGHLLCARAVAEARGFDRIELIPTGEPPHKPHVSDIASGTDRHEMAALAVKGSSQFAVNDLEMRRSGPSYTIDTVRELKRERSGPVHWLIGADMLLYLPQWHQSLELMQEVNFVIMARPGWKLHWSQLPVEYHHLEVNVVEVPLIDISASEIRLRTQLGKSIEYLTPEPVCRYIRDHGLYR